MKHMTSHWEYEQYDYQRQDKVSHIMFPGFMNAY